jgi:predicted GNAT family acetyltransferase
VQQLNSAALNLPYQQLPGSDQSAVQVVKLRPNHEAEVLQFLSRRPLHTVALAGLIRDNGLVSPLNRGGFYGCRNRAGKLEGVALIGHAILLETSTDRALEALATTAQTCTTAHLILGEEQRINEFWSYYAEAGQPKRHAGRELLFELRWPVEVFAEASRLRRATAAELEMILPIQAQMAFEESGVNPLERDPEGFRLRCLRRIEQGRTWVWVADGELIFKADVVSDTPEVIYLEGVWTNERHRSQGHALRCLSQLSRGLLQRAQSVCVLVNEQNSGAHSFYQRAGFKRRAIYDTIFLNQ